MKTKEKISLISICIVIVFAIFFCYSYYKNGETEVDSEQLLSYCNKQVKKTLFQIQNDSCLLPRNIDKDSQKWNMIDAYDWTSGFWPGILWYDYEYTQDDFIKNKAIQYTNYLKVLLNKEHKGDHDLGFQ
ncbi:MAG: glucuronyl hydrolase, partial [Prevotellaceae bacterium]|nr:glucuronyl hydrolase [Prevotellaceae bacterium]